MKTKVTILLLLTSLFCCCDNNITDESDIIQSELQDVHSNIDINKRSYTEALDIAKKSIPMIERAQGLTRGVSAQRTINQKDGVVTICSDAKTTRSGNKQVDTLLYVFNFDNNEGFAVVSANRNTEGLIAVTESGHYQLDNTIENPGFALYMEQAKSYVETAKQIDASTANTTIKDWIVTLDTISYVEIPKRIQVNWDQGGVAGQFCPNYIAGCGPTAALQIMSYFKRPSYFQYTYPNSDKTYQLVNWYQINQHQSVYSHPSTLCTTYPDLDATIGRIFRQVGHAAGATYHTDGTGTSTSIYNVLTVLQSYNYQISGVKEYTVYTNLIPDLQDGKLIYMRGSNSSGGGHAWVVDGGSRLEGRSIAVISEDGINWQTYWDRMITVTYNHINWGWSGTCNGLFLNIEFDANKSFKPDTSGSSTVNGDVEFDNSKKYATVYYNN